MKPFTLQLDGTEETAKQALGAVLCAQLRLPLLGRTLQKGHVISEAELPALGAISGVHLSLIQIEAGDVHEDEAAMRLGRAVAGPGVEVKGPVGAKARLLAADRGLLQVDQAVLQAMNSIEGVSIYTQWSGQPVEAGELVAEAKVTPLVVPGNLLLEAEAFPAAITVLSFLPRKAAALVRERISIEQAMRVSNALAAKLAYFGSSLESVEYVSPDAPPDELGALMNRLLEAGARLLLVSGGSASDPADPLLNALSFVPATMEGLGTPSHPGSMLWLAYAGAVPIIGVPSCGSFSEATSLDLVLPLLFAGLPLTNLTLAGLGHGGLLHAGDYRLPNYSAPK